MVLGKIHFPAALVGDNLSLPLAEVTYNNLDRLKGHCMAIFSSHIKYCVTTNRGFKPSTTLHHNTS